MRPAVSLIIPCLNEEDNIRPTIERIAALQPAANNWEVLIVDDGSTDNTANVTRAVAGHYPWVRLVQHPRNLGLGAAIKTGFAHARGEIVCSMDCDCTFAPERLPDLIGLVRHGADIATGSPWDPASGKGDVHPVRKALSQGCSNLYRVVLRSKLRSYTSIFRAYRREVIERIPVTSTGFIAVAEILVDAQRAGYRVLEMPVRLDRRVHGESKIKVASAIRAHVRLMTRLAWLAWTPQSHAAAFSGARAR